VDVHFEGGRIRGLARRAFQGRVPKPILDRQWKDRPIAAPAAIVQGNLPFIREMLLDGHLTENRILDRPALDAALSAEPNRQRAVASEILAHLDMELWLRGSISRCA
jgi:asparagine synthase (glutamine-hydrolysing)